MLQVTTSCHDCQYQHIKWLCPQPRHSVQKFNGGMSWPTYCNRYAATDSMALTACGPGGGGGGDGVVVVVVVHMQRSEPHPNSQAAMCAVLCECPSSKPTCVCPSCCHACRCLVYRYGGIKLTLSDLHESCPLCRGCCTCKACLGRAKHEGEWGWLAGSRLWGSVSLCVYVCASAGLSVVTCRLQSPSVCLSLLSLCLYVSSAGCLGL
jgi:hypothetical protein